MRAAYRQHDAGPIVNLARHPRGTAFLNTGQFPKWHADRWGADGVYTTYTGLANHPEGITTGVRWTVTNTPRSSHGFHIAGNPEASPPSVNLHQMMPVRPGERITISGWFRYTGAQNQAFAFRFRPTNEDASAYLDNGLAAPSTALPSGAWVKLSLSYTVPPGSGYVAIYVTNGSGAPNAIGDQYDGTGLMVTRTPAPQANIAGDPNATRVTIPSRNFGWNSQWFGSGGSGTTEVVTGATDGPDEITTYLRKTWSVIGTNLSNVSYNHASVTRPSVSPGDTLTLSSYFRASKGWAVSTDCRMVLQWFDGAGVQIGVASNGPQFAGPVVAGAWHELSITATAPANAVSVFVYQRVEIQNGSWAPGDTIDGTGLMVTRTPPRWGFADGDSPGWRWLGAVNTSESAGYPKPS